MGKPQSQSGLINVISYDTNGNISFVSGSTTLMSVSSSKDITTTGKITAQTLVVQTITSSVDFVTGSTKFGSLATNTHQFTGSMFVTGAFYVATGSVGIGTVSPSQLFEVVGGEIKAGRVDSSNEGGQVSFGRSTDNATAWYIDAYGNVASPQLRFVNVTNAVVAMTITGSNVGIGTSTPVGKLDVSTGANSNIVISNDSIDTGYNIVALNGTRTKGSYAGIAGGGSADNNLYLNSGVDVVIQTGASFTQAMRITSGGQVQVKGTGTLLLDGSSNNLIRSAGNSNLSLYASNNGASGTGEMNFYTQDTSRLRIFYDGYIALNSVVFGTTTSGTVRTLYIGTGAGYLIGGISSVRHSKKNIKNVSNVDWLQQLTPVIFNYRKKDEKGNYTEEIYEDLNYGLIAEDTAPIADFLINYNNKEDGTKEMIGIEYPRLIVPLLKAIQELKAEIDELKNNK